MATQPIEDIPYYTGPESFLQPVETAARYAGEAAGMATRYANVGDGQRAIVWTEEHHAWRARMEERIEGAPVQRGNLAMLGDFALNSARAEVQVYYDPTVLRPSSSNAPNSSQKS